MNMPEVIPLCGSTRFKDTYLRVLQALTLEGKIVLMPGVFSHSDGIVLSLEEKQRLDELHVGELGETAPFMVRWLPEHPKHERLPQTAAFKPRRAHRVFDFRKIDMSHGIYVPDCDGYIGENTRRKIAYAQQRGKFVRCYSQFFLEGKHEHP